MADILDRLKAALADRYRIERELGSGGMATVYLAQDVKHERQVALKVLRPELAAALGPERFHQEIKIAANLHHPHILPLYDSGDADGFLYYVMPYEEGQSLRDKLTHEGELPIGEAVRILRDVVDALSHAHKHGVVHRDIKPDNVMLSERHALVTDFGVAKAVSEATGAHRLTTEGVALGTPAYMSPEQAAADKHIDHRADIYAVGALAYELLTGRPPFTGTTPQEVLSAQVTQAPDPVTRYRATVPPALAHVVMKCLGKKAADRWQSAQELLPQLEALATPSGGVTPTDVVPVPSRTSRAKTIGIIAGVVVIVAIAGVLTLRSKPHAPLFQPGHTTQVTRARGLEVDPAFSPDGRTLAYAAGTPDRTRLYVNQLGGGGTIALTEALTGNHRSPHWSPDASQLAYESQGAIFAIPVFGGTPRRIVGRSTDSGSGEVGADGVFHSPVWSPGGDNIAYVWQERPPGAATQRAPSEIYVLSLSGGERRKVADAVEAHSLSWSPDGSKLAFASGASLFVFGAADFGDFGNVDPSSIWVVESEGGEPVQVTSEYDLNVSPVWWRDGRHLLFVSNRDGRRDIYQVAITTAGAPRGDPIRITTGLDAHTFDVSPDGTRLSYSEFAHTANLWSLEIPSSGAANVARATPVTNEAQVVEFVDVSPDGRWLAFCSNREGNQDIYRMPIGGGDPQRLTNHPSDDYHPSWSPTGREIAFYSLRNGNRDVFVMSADGGRLQQITDHPAQDRHAVWSPTGDIIVFASDRTGRPELYLITRGANTRDWSEPEQLTVEGGLMPRWSPDGSEIVYAVQDSVGILRIVSLESRAGRLLMQAEQGQPVPWFARWSLDGSVIYYSARVGNVIHSMWSVPASGGQPQLIAHLDDLVGGFPMPWFAVDANRFYFVIHEFEANLSVMELLR